MSAERAHSHPCQSCGAPVDCEGTREANYDGFPAVICLVFHLQNGTLNPAFICENCACVDCGERATTLAKNYTGPESYTPVKVCDDCNEKRDNYEPPDADGEAFRGGEAAAFQAEQAQATWRMK